MQESPLLNTAIKLAETLNKTADNNLPKKLAEIVKMYSILAVGYGFIYRPEDKSADNILAMYVEINDELNMPFAENALKSVAAGVVTNLARTAVGLTEFGLFPGVKGEAVITFCYAVTIASGIVYMKAITALLNSKNTTFTEADFKAATDEVMKDKETITEILKEGKAEYKNRWC